MNHRWEGPQILLDRTATWAGVCRDFTHWLPAEFNVGRAVAHTGDAEARSRLAILQVQEDGEVVKWTFGELDRLSDRLANALRAHGVTAGDRVAVWLPQSFELVLAHVASYKLGAVVVPLFVNFGHDALVTRVNGSGARVLFVGDANAAQIVDGRGDMPSVDLVLSIACSSADGSSPAASDFWNFLKQGSELFQFTPTSCEDPAFLCYTSGTTGSPKGALHAHRVLLGHLAGISVTHNLAPRPGDLFWTPADWGWMGGLFDVLFPALYWGIPVVAYRMPKFDPEETYHVLERFDVQNAFIPPTAMRLMKSVPNPRERWSLRLRTIASGGESLGAETLEWAERELGADVNEFYGQTECNLILGNCKALFPNKGGSMGRPLPGRNVHILGATGEEAAIGEVGEVVVAADDPIAMLGYWNNDAATQAKISNGVLHTGDLASCDEDGDFFFVGRNDDVISSAGYRIGPTDIENALYRHPRVSMVAVIGTPDPVRGESVKAVVVLSDGGVQEESQLTAELQDLVRSTVGSYAYPRQIEYVTELPMTSTGKVQRGKLRDRDKARLTDPAPD